MHEKKYVTNRAKKKFQQKGQLQSNLVSPDWRSGGSVSFLFLFRNANCWRERVGFYWATDDEDRFQRSTFWFCRLDCIFTGTFNLTNSKLARNWIERHRRRDSNRTRPNQTKNERTGPKSETKKNEWLGFFFFLSEWICWWDDGVTRFERNEIPFRILRASLSLSGWKGEGEEEEEEEEEEEDNGVPSTRRWWVEFLPAMRLARVPIIATWTRVQIRVSCL